MVLLAARNDLRLIKDVPGLTLLTLLTAAGKRLDLFDLVVIQCGRWGLAALIGSINRVVRERERVTPASVGEHRSEHLAVLVDVARRKPLAVE
jgi:hypothetical protein